MSDKITKPIAKSKAISPQPTKVVQYRYLWMLKDSPSPYTQMVVCSEQDTIEFEKRILSLNPIHFVREYVCEFDLSRMFESTVLADNSNKEDF